MKLFLLTIASLVTMSCGSSPDPDERRGVPPPGSDEESSFPWSIPTAPTGGPLGGALNQR